MLRRKGAVSWFNLLRKSSPEGQQDEAEHSHAENTVAAPAASMMKARLGLNGMRHFGRQSSYGVDLDQPFWQPSKWSFRSNIIDLKKRTIRPCRPSEANEVPHGRTGNTSPSRLRTTGLHGPIGWASRRSMGRGPPGQGTSAPAEMPCRRAVEERTTRRWRGS